MRQRRFGCGGLFAFLFLALLAVLFYEWPAFIDAKGAETAGSITEKREGVRVRYGDWFRQFDIVAAYRAPGSPMERHAICDVEQGTYDSLHIGDRVTVHYFPALVQQPFIPATHLSPCTPAGNFGSNPDLYRRMALVFGCLAPILFLIFVLRIRLAVWLLVPWFGLFLFYCAIPHAEPAPARPRPSKATVGSISLVDEILGGTGSGTRRSSGPIKLDHPYQLVRLEFTPAGAVGPVVALDTVDLNSIAGLAPRETVDIDYDAANPRVARIRGGTRNFPEQARRQVMILYAALAGVVIAGFMLLRSIRLMGPGRLVCRSLCRTKHLEQED